MFYFFEDVNQFTVCLIQGELPYFCSESWLNPENVRLSDCLSFSLCFYRCCHPFLSCIKSGSVGLNDAVKQETWGKNLGDKTVDDKLMYIPNDVIQNYSFCSWILIIEKFFY